MIGLRSNAVDNERMEYRICTIVDGDTMLSEWRCASWVNFLREIRRIYMARMDFSIEFRVKQ